MTAMTHDRATGLRYLTEAQRKVAIAYADAGWLVFVRRGRKSGKVGVSLGGGREMTIAEAMTRMREALARD